MDDSRPDLRESRRQIRWWHWLILAFCVVWMGGLFWLMTALDDDRTQELASVTYAGDVGVPGQVLLPSLHEQPVPGWRINFKAVLGDIVRPSIEHVGDAGPRAYFTVSGMERTTGMSRAWLLGVDVEHGVPAFAPVQIDKPNDVACLLNGAARVLCLNTTYGQPQGEAWVLDAQTGAVLSRTVSSLQFNTFSLDDVPKLLQIGTYAVAYEPGTGWHGIDDQARFTWTVAADTGDMTALKPQPGMPPSNIGVATIDKDHSGAFSAVDGKLLGMSGGKLVPVVGGFVEQEPGNGWARTSRDRFVFYDQDGKRVGQYDDQSGGPGLFRPSLTSTELPVLELLLSDQALVLDNRGVPMTVVPVRPDSVMESIRFLGGSMYLTERDFDSIGSGSGVVSKFDLRSGNRVTSCMGLPMDEDGFVGSDGTVVVAREAGGNERKAPTVGVDLDTCTVLWKITEPGPMWAVGTTLVQALPASGELISLVPPARRGA